MDIHNVVSYMLRRAGGLPKESMGVLASLARPVGVSRCGVKKIIMIIT